LNSITAGRLLIASVQLRYELFRGVAAVNGVFARDPKADK